MGEGCGQRFHEIFTLYSFSSTDRNRRAGLVSIASAESMTDRLGERSSRDIAGTHVQRVRQGEASRPSQTRRQTSHTNATSGAHQNAPEMQLATVWHGQTTCPEAWEERGEARQRTRPMQDTLADARARRLALTHLFTGHMQSNMAQQGNGGERW